MSVLGEAMGNALVKGAGIIDKLSKTASVGIGAVKGMIYSPGVLNFIGVLSQFIEWGLNWLFKPRLATDGEMRDAYQRDIIDWETYQTYMPFWGYNPDYLDVYKELDKKRLDVKDIYLALWRGAITSEEKTDMLRKIGFWPEQIKIIDTIMEQRPSPQDIVRFSVRDAYSPATIETFNLTAELPQKFVEEMKKSGFSEEIAQDYWVSHWELPSTTAGYTMFQRGIITEEELKLLLKQQDYAPFWRPKLIQLNYQPITRVDIRRLIKAGLLNPDEATQRYKDIGYSPENAEKLAQFAIMQEQPAQRDLTRSDIVKAVQEEVMSNSDGIKELVKIGYDTQEASRILAISKAEQAELVKQAQTVALQEQYIDGSMTETEFRSNLSNIYSDTEVINLILAEVELKIAKKYKTLTTSEIIKARKKGLMPLSDALDKLNRLGYSTYDANLLISINDAG